MSEIEDITTDIVTSGKSISMIATRNDLIFEAEKDNIKMTSRRDMELNSTINNVNVHAKHCVDILTDEKSVNIKSHCGKVNIDAKKSIKMKSSYGCVTVKSDREEVNIESYEDMEITSKTGDITVEASNGTVNIKALNNVNILPGLNGSVVIEGHLHATSLSQGMTGDNGLLVPTGTVVPYCGTTGTTGWFLCDGSSYSRITYNALFLVIGYTFGGSGEYFNVPDMRGRIPLGASYQIPNISDKSVGNTGGSETHTLTINEMPAHTHTFDRGFGGWENSTYYVSGASDRPNTGSDVETTSSTGGSAPHSIMQPYMVLNFIIKY